MLWLSQSDAPKCLKLKWMPAINLSLITLTSCISGSRRFPQLCSQWDSEIRPSEFGSTRSWQTSPKIWRHSVICQVIKNQSLRFPSTYKKVSAHTSVLITEQDTSLILFLSCFACLRSEYYSQKIWKPLLIAFSKGTCYLCATFNWHICWSRQGLTVFGVWTTTKSFLSCSVQVNCATQVSTCLIVSTMNALWEMSTTTCTLAALNSLKMSRRDVHSTSHLPCSTI